MKVSDYIVTRLAQHGIRHVFLVTGGGAMHLNDSFGRSSEIAYFCNHHEQAAAIAAEGYFRATGRMAAVNVTSGPGGTNTMTGVIGQWLDSIPCFYVSGQVKQQTTIAACPDLKLRQLGDQEINIVDLVKPVTKYAVMVRDPMTIRYHVDKAMHIARAGRPGPVWLDIPLDVQGATIDENALPAYDPREDAYPFDPLTLQTQVATILERLRNAKRPVILAGHGIRLADAVETFRELVGKLQAPVCTAIGGHDLLWSDHPLFFGRPGICGDRWGNMVIQNSDFMLAIGTRMGIRQIGYSHEAFAREAFRVMVDVDPAELQKPTLHLDMAVHADAGDFINEMLKQLGGDSPASKREWMTWCRGLRKKLPTFADDNSSQPDRFVNSYRFVEELMEQIAPPAMVVTGNGTAYTCTFQVMPLKKDVRVFANQGCAAMGYDLPAAIGASIALGKKPVILITGDGSIQMNIQELQTIVHYGLPIKIFLLNNEGYLAIRITQNTYFDQRHVGSDPDSGVVLPNMRAVAAAYGLATYEIPDEHDLAERIARVLAAPGPCLCDVNMDPCQTLYPKLSSRADENGVLHSSPLEDMYPFLDRDAFHNLMIIPPLDAGEHPRKTPGPLNRAAAGK